jgi:ABC-type multidrug transport system fused ATPase/permease subunit
VTSLDSELKEWPTKGEVEFKSVSMRYRKDTDLALREMSFKVKAGEKVGCVGRTGAGKSTIL